MPLVYSLDQRLKRWGLEPSGLAEVLSLRLWLWCWMTAQAKSDEDDHDYL